MVKVIFRPEDPVRVEQLKAKREEYRERLARQSQDASSISAMRDTACKLAILDCVIENGFICTEDLLSEMERVDPEIRSHFKDACDVVNDYCTTGGENLRGGTGLKMPEDTEVSTVNVIKHGTC